MPAGRPSDYTPETADAICDRLIEGESLRKICTDADMPNRRTVLRWLEARSEFAAKYARARDSQADLMDDMILDEAATATKDNAAAVRVKVDAYKWRAAKLQPKKYGDAVQMKHSGAIGTFDPSKLSDEQLTRVIDVLGPIAASLGDGEGGEGGTGAAEG